MAPWGAPAPFSAGAVVQPSTVVTWRRDVNSSSTKQIQSRVGPLLPVLTGGRHDTPDRMRWVGQKRE